MQSTTTLLPISLRALWLKQLGQGILSLFLVFALYLSYLPTAISAATVHKSKSSSAVKAPVKTATPEKSTKTATPSSPEIVENYVETTPEELVDKPQEYLNKNVKFTAKFFAFSSLALDYKPAFRSSKTYLSFLVLRSHNHVPLSELKLALLIPKEKDPENQLIAVLKDGDTVELSGKVFSTALSEPWMDVQHIKKIASSDEKSAEGDPEQESKTTETPANQAPETKHEPSKQGAQ